MYEKLSELRKRRENGEGGFTLIELLVVVVIIGVLIAIAIPLYLNYEHGAQNKSAQSDLRNAVVVMEQCASDNGGAYPTAAPLTGVAITASVNLTCGAATERLNISSQTTMHITSTGTAWTGDSQNNGQKTYTYDSTVGGSIQ